MFFSLRRYVSKVRSIRRSPSFVPCKPNWAPYAVEISYVNLSHLRLRTEGGHRVSEGDCRRIKLLESGYQIGVSAGSLRMGYTLTVFDLDISDNGLGFSTMSFVNDRPIKGRRTISIRHGGLTSNNRIPGYVVVYCSH